jgi:hypothetical protein
MYADDASLLLKKPCESEKGISPGWLFFRQACYGSPHDAGEPDDSKDDRHRRDEKEKSYAKDTQAKSRREWTHGTSHRTLGRALAGSDGNQLLIQ